MRRLSMVLAESESTHLFYLEKRGEACESLLFVSLAAHKLQIGHGGARGFCLCGDGNEPLLLFMLFTVTLPSA